LPPSTPEREETQNDQRNGCRLSSVRRGCGATPVVTGWRHRLALREAAAHLAGGEAAEAIGAEIYGVAHASAGASTDPGAAILVHRARLTEAQPGGDASITEIRGATLETRRACPVLARRGAHQIPVGVDAIRGQLAAVLGVHALGPWPAEIAATTEGFTAMETRRASGRAGA